VSERQAPLFQPAPPLPARARAILGRVGQTPLIELDFARELRPSLPASTRVFAKLETVNPGGSIKDRPIARILQRARAEHGLGSRSERRLLDSSSGNAGIAYAMLGAALEVPVTLVVPANASAERLDRIRAHGAELILTDPLDGYDFAVQEAARLAREQPHRYVYACQYSNAENPLAHERGTGAELLRQLGGAPDLFVAGIGTGGTLTGVGRALRAARPDVAIGTVVPDLFPGIEGLKPLGAPGDLVPAILDETLIDHRVPVRLEEAVPLCHALARRGLFVGPSSGANLFGALELAERHGYGRVATLLCDTGERYGSTGLWRGL
jgi:cysteine synthase B